MEKMYVLEKFQFKRIVRRSLVIFLVMAGILIHALPVMAQGDLCLPSTGWWTPAIDGNVSNDNGWYAANQVNLNAGTGAYRTAIFQAEKDGSYVYLSLFVESPYADKDDTIVLGLSTDGSNSHDWRIHIKPFNSAVGPGSGNFYNQSPDAVTYWRDSTTWNNNINTKTASPGFWLMDNIRVSKTSSNWSIEIKIPWGTNPAFAGNDDMIYFPNSQPFKFYINVLATSFSIGTYTQAPWPEGTIMVGSILTPDATQVTPPKTSWGNISLYPRTECTGVSLAWEDIGTTNADPHEIRLGTTPPIPSNCNGLDNTVSVGPINTFFAKPYNTMNIPAKDVTVNFSLANWGIQSYSEWQPIGPQGLLPGDLNPTAPKNIGPGQKSNITLNWSLTQWQRCQYNNTRHQCMKVEMDSTNASVRFLNKGLIRNMDFVPSSKFQRTAIFDVAEPLPQGRTEHELIITVDTEKSKYVKDGPIYYPVQRKAYGLNEIPTETYPCGLSETEMVVYRGYLSTGKYLVINGNRYEYAELKGGFGYIAGHRGNVKEWERDFIGDRVYKVSDNLYKVNIPYNSKVVAESTIESIPQPRVPPRLILDEAAAPDHDLATILPYTWDAQTFNGFAQGLDGSPSSETLTVNQTSLGTTKSDKTRTIMSSNLIYSTEVQHKRLKVAEALTNLRDTAADDFLTSRGLEQAAPSKAFDGGSYTTIGWLGENYIALNGKANKLARLIIEQGTAASEKKILTVGETWDVGGGWTLTANSIDAKANPRQVWLTLSKDGAKKDDKVINMDTPIYTYVEKSLASETDVPVFVTYVDSVFAGATADMVQLRYTWAVDTSITQVKIGDTYGAFRAVQADNQSLTLKNVGAPISLTRDATISLAGNFGFKVEDDDLLKFKPIRVTSASNRMLSGYGMIPGDQLIRGYTLDEKEWPEELETGFSFNGLNSEVFDYDLKDGLPTESLTIEQTNLGASSCKKLIIENGNLTYSTTAYAKKLNVVKALNLTDNTAMLAKGLDQAEPGKGFDGGNYWRTGYMGEKYVALNGKPNKLAKLLVEQGTTVSERKTLSVGETWEIGGGWTLTANSIDAKATPRQVWLTLSKDGVKKDDKVISAGTPDARPIYTYAEKSLGGETDVPVFVTYVDSVFAGATTDMVQLRYTWAVDPVVTEFKPGDKFGVFEVSQIDNRTLKFENTRTSLSLSPGSEVNLAGHLNFKVGDDTNYLRFSPVFDLFAVPVPPTPTETTPTPTTPVMPTPTKQPGFEVVFAVAGLLAAVHIVLRKRM